MKYAYPARLEPDEEFGGFCVFFPDLENVFTQGDDLDDALFMAEDALIMMLEHMERRGDPIPKPSALSAVKAKPGDVVRLVSCDTEDYFAERAEAEKRHMAAISQ